MYNTQVPDRASLPSASRLFRSTLLAAVIAAVLLVTIVMPAEYGVDPTGVGSVLGLKAMGEAKLALAREAGEASSRPAAAAPAAPAVPAAPAAPAVSAAPAVPAVPAATPIAPPPAAAAPAAPLSVSAPRSDEKSYLLKPGQGMEVKLTMREGARVEYSWEATDGVVNFDAHGDSDSKPVMSHSYKKGTGVAGDQGVLEAKFSGKHGWYWRNRGKGNVVVTLRTSGAYSAIDRVL